MFSEKAAAFARKIMISGIVIIAAMCADSILQITAIHQAWALYQTGTKWPTPNIQVCWETGLDTRFGTGSPTPASSAPNFAIYSRWARDAIEDSWGRVASLRFIGWGDCTSRTDTTLAGWVTIVWTNVNNTSIGYRTDAWTRMGLIRPADTSEASRIEFQATIRHEMGHALGFQHELDRPDAPRAPGGTPAGCNYGANISGTYLTPNDPSSIMNHSYCDAASAGTLSPFDIMGIQKLYGRKPAGSIVGLGGRCVDIPGVSKTPGTDLIAYDCYGAANDTWIRPYGRLQLLANYDPALGPYIMGLETFPPNPFGTPVEIATWLPGGGFSPNQEWFFTAVEWKAIGDLCVAPRSVASGSQLEVQACNGLAIQRWDLEESGRFRLSGTSYCANVAGASTKSGTPIVLYPCGSPPYPNETFGFTDAGAITWSGNCFNVSGGYPIPGSAIILYPCGAAGSPYQNEQFHVTGQITAAGQCLDMTGGVSFNGVPIEVYPCASARNQLWDYYFLTRPAPPGR